MTDGQTDLDESYYGKCASLYDMIATAPGIVSWRQTAVDSLELSAGDVVVDLGCGTGANFPYLREAVGDSGRVVGVDVVSAMLQQAHKRVTRAGWDNVHVVRGDATRLPIPNADAILSTFLVGMLDSPDSAVRNWMQVLNPGDRITLMNAGRSEHLFVRPANLLCRAFVRLTAPGNRWQRDSAVQRLENRWNLASEALFEGTDEHVDERLGLGFVRLASGRVRE